MIELKPIDVVADYAVTALGTWRVAVSANGNVVDGADGSTIEDVFVGALDIFDRISHDNGGRPCATIHTLEGDPAKFAVLAEEHGLRVPPGRGIGTTLWS